MSYIHKISTVVPENRVNQNEFSEYYGDLGSITDARKIKYLANKSGIDYRYSVVENLNDLFQLSIEEKMAIFSESAPKLAIKAIENLKLEKQQFEKFTDIVFVSCTGMSAPGIEFDLINHFNLNPKIARLNVNFMGCYAGITALRQAKNILAAKPSAEILMINVELCTLHFQPRFDDDYLLSNMLFADGCTAITLSNKESSHLLINNFQSLYIPDSLNLMSWNISQNGFLMTLKADVPKKLKVALQTMSNQYMDDTNTKFAVHPGGIQILKATEEAFNIESEKLSASYSVLKKYGNMSSCTIFFVLQEMIQKGSLVSGNNIWMAAFGPGLTLETSLIKYV